MNAGDEEKTCSILWANFFSPDHHSCFMDGTHVDESDLVTHRDKCNFQSRKGVFGVRMNLFLPRRRRMRWEKQPDHTTQGSSHPRAGGEKTWISLVRPSSEGEAEARVYSAQQVNPIRSRQGFREVERVWQLHIPVSSKSFPVHLDRACREGVPNAGVSSPPDGKHWSHLVQELRGRDSTRCTSMTHMYYPRTGTAQHRPYLSSGDSDPSFKTR